MLTVFEVAIGVFLGYAVFDHYKTEQRKASVRKSLDDIDRWRNSLNNIINDLKYHANKEEETTNE